MPTLRLAALIALVALVAACTEEPAPSGPFVTSRIETIVLPGYGPPNIDLLLLVDDTATMQPYQTRIAELPALLQVTMHTLYGGMGAFRVAVATNSGALRTSPSIPDGFLEDIGHFDGTHTTNYDGTISAALATITNVGTAGATSQPLAAMQSALDHPFMRDHAYLAIVTISASDDTSPGAPIDYATMLKSRRTDPANVVVSGIFYAPDVPRLDEFHQAFPNRSNVTPIGAMDWSDAFTLLAQLYRVPLGAPCFVQPLDLDPDAAGDQFDCSFTWTDRGVEHILPICGTAVPCVEFVPSPQACPGDRPNLLRFTGWAGRPDVRGQCVVK